MKNIEQYLVQDKGFLPEQLRKIKIKFLEQKNNNPHLTFINYILSNQMINEKDLVDFYTEYTEFSFVDLLDYKINKDVIQAIPPEIARKYGIIPIKIVNDYLYLVMTDPYELLAIEAAKRYSRLRIKVFVSYYSSIRRTINQVYGIEKTDNAIR